jgi:hypothetical protein
MKLKDRECNTVLLGQGYAPTQEALTDEHVAMDK